MTKRLSPLGSSAAFTQFVLDQLGALEVTSRAMFGGRGLYHEDLFFGIIAGDTLYLKVDERSRQPYVDAGMKPFRPYVRRPVTMKYYAVPLDVLESAPQLERWARAAIAVAREGSRMVVIERPKRAAMTRATRSSATTKAETSTGASRRARKRR